MVIELFLIGVGLSMDAFAVSVCKGLGMEKINKKHAFLIGLYFGGFQALMPFLGWALGIRFQKYITSVDHWIAFFLLLFIGGKMVVEGIRSRGEDVEKTKLGLGTLMVQGIATSIDALSVGFTIAEYGFAMALTASLIIAAITFFICITGLVIGKKFGTRFSNKASILGGVILIAIGLEIFITGVF